MSIQEDPGEIYPAGYAAFDQGDYSTAIRAAGRCLAIAPANSYWRFGALGLRCLAANYLGDLASVEQDARQLLAEPSGIDKFWFDGLAWLNLGLAYRQQGRMEAAQQAFDQASACYAAYQIRPKQPPTWTFIVKYFAVLTAWGANGKADPLQELTDSLKSVAQPDAELARLAQALELILRHTHGEEVRSEALAAAEQGVSRTYLALILLS